MLTLHQRMEGRLPWQHVPSLLLRSLWHSPLAKSQHQVIIYGVKGFAPIITRLIILIQVPVLSVHLAPVHFYLFKA